MLMFPLSVKQGCSIRVGTKEVAEDKDKGQDIPHQQSRLAQR